MPDLKGTGSKLLVESLFPFLVSNFELWGVEIFSEMASFERVPELDICLFIPVILACGEPPGLTWPTVWVGPLSELAQDSLNSYWFPLPTLESPIG